MENAYNNFINSKVVYEEMKKEYRTKQHNFWEGVLEKIKESNSDSLKQYFKEKQEIIYGAGQYEEISWIRLHLLDNVIGLLKGTDYEGATAIHIMPYCITAEDVMNAVSDKEEANKNYKIALGKTNRDTKTGNFHKKIDYSDIKNLQPQIVLVNKNAPVKPKCNRKRWKKKELAERVKTHWYFPPIEEENEKHEKIQTQKDFEAMIKKLLNDVITAIEERKTTAVE